MSAKKPFALKPAAFAAACALLALVCLELYSVAVGSGHVVARLSWKWLAVIVVYLVGAALALFGLRRVLFNKKVTKAFVQSALRARRSLGKGLYLAAVVAIVFPAFFIFFSPWGALFTGFFTRLLVFALCAALAAFLLSKTQLLDWNGALLSGLLVGSALVMAESLVLVTNYPFGLHWSEGNRLWDYSLAFGSQRYNNPAGEPIFAWIDKGRQYLWGLPFLLPGLPIWGARLWNAILTTVPYALLGWAAFRPLKTARALWAVAGLWALLFLNQGPIYAPLILAAVLVALARRAPIWLALPLVYIAGHYAGVSRFTWIYAAGIWAVLLTLSDALLLRSQLEIKDWLRAAALGLAGIWSKGVPVLLGLVKGLLPAAAPLTQPVPTPGPGGQSIQTLQGLQAATTGQPYAWGRLLPNEVYAPGIIIGLLLATLPLVILLVYAIRTRIWRSTRFQLLVTSLGTLAFLVVGLIASAKVGGGADLHNLDMFLVTLVLLAGLAWEAGLHKKLRNIGALPAGIRLALVALVFLPAFAPTLRGLPLQLPERERTQFVLDRIRAEVECARQYGDVLFMDQRQLLTFHQIEGIPLVVEYEKKYVMDQALAGNESYFAQFEEDLASGRFSLIVTEREAILYKEADEDSFGDGLVEENNAWVKWVTIPLFRHYESVANFRDTAVELFVPIQRDFDCE
jgi:hypothetical protein